MRRGNPNWTKGKSGNPDGRPKKTPEHYEVEELARSHSPAAIERLAYWMRSKDGPVSVKACVAMLDRAFGKPAQEVRHKKHGPSSLEDFRDSQLAAILARGIARIGGGAAGSEDRPRAQGNSRKLN